MGCTVRYADGRRVEWGSIQTAVTMLLVEYPDGVVCDARGWAQDALSDDSHYNVSDGLAAFVWAREADSDDPSDAVARVEVKPDGR